MEAHFLLKMPSQLIGLEQITRINPSRPIFTDHGPDSKRLAEHEGLLVCHDSLVFEKTHSNPRLLGERWGCECEPRINITKKTREL
jgi:hypothetical protein